MHAIETVGFTKHYHPPLGAFGAVASMASGRERPAPIVALDSLDLQVQTGEVFGFLGPNGAGKSTLIRLLLGFLHSTEGTGRVLGMDCREQSVAIRARVGYLPGGIALHDSLTGEGVLDYLAKLSGRPPIHRAELCQQLELSASTLTRRVREYSRGMRQKIGIVQALQHGPELAILDEPTEGLDPLMQRAFYEIIDQIKAAGRTVFFSSHVLSEVERVCDRVAIVRQGRLVALEGVTDLLARRKRKVEMRIAGELPMLTSVAGVSGIVVADDRLTCYVEGDVRPLLAAIVGCEMMDLTIEPARLEEAFLEFYQAEVTE